MRAYRRGRAEEEEESVFVSMTDMTVGFLFIVMIMLVFFATQFSEPDTVSRESHELVLAQRDTAGLERDEAFARLIASKSRIAQLVTQRHLLAQEVEIAETRLARLDRELERIRDERDVLSDQLREAETRIAELEERLEQLQNRTPIEAYLAEAASTRSELLRRILAELVERHPDILDQVQITADALRFQGEGLFASGSVQVRQERADVLSDLAEILDEMLRCYTFGETEGDDRWNKGCNEERVLIESVQIEGHTDTVGGRQYNLNLSTNRSVNAFNQMVEEQEALASDHLNLSRQPVMGVAGYGQMRLAVDTDDNMDEPRNRRIDLRVIMHTPVDAGEIERIRQRFEAFAG